MSELPNLKILVLTLKLDSMKPLESRGLGDPVFDRWVASKVASILASSGSKLEILSVMFRKDLYHKYRSEGIYPAQSFRITSEGTVARLINTSQEEDELLTPLLEGPMWGWPDIVNHELETL